MLNSCYYGLFKGNNGSFMPTSSITNGQALAVATRMIDWYKDESKNTHRAMQYYKYMKEQWYTEWIDAHNMTNINKPITRWDLAILFARMHNRKTQALTEESARKEAIESKVCEEIGALESTGYYNSTSQTRWFNAINRINNCSPACVVHKYTKITEINRRCGWLL